MYPIDASYRCRGRQLSRPLRRSHPLRWRQVFGHSITTSVTVGLVALVVALAAPRTGYAQSTGSIAGAYIGLGVAPIVLHARQFDVKPDGSKTWLDYSQPGVQVDVRYGESLSPQVQLEGVVRARYASYGALRMVDVPGFSQTLERKPTPGFYAAATIGPHIVYSFFERNKRVTPGRVPSSGLYVSAGIGASVSLQSSFTLRPAEIGGEEISIVSTDLAVGVAPYVSVGVGGEYASGNWKFTFAYTFDAEIDFGAIEATNMIHAVTIGVRL